jgi:hypothetical protein
MLEKILKQNKIIRTARALILPKPPHHVSNSPIF